MSPENLSHRSRKLDDRSRGVIHDATTRGRFWIAFPWSVNDRVGPRSVSIMCMT